VLVPVHLIGTALSSFGVTVIKIREKNSSPTPAISKREVPQLANRYLRNDENLTSETKIFPCNRLSFCRPTFEHMNQLVYYTADDEPEADFVGHRMTRKCKSNRLSQVQGGALCSEQVLTQESTSHGCTSTKLTKAHDEETHRLADIKSYSDRLNTKSPCTSQGIPIRQGSSGSSLSSIDHNHAADRYAKAQQQLYYNSATWRLYHRIHEHRAKRHMKASYYFSHEDETELIFVGSNNAVSNQDASHNRHQISQEEPVGEEAYEKSIDQHHSQAEVFDFEL
jgi:hypothetical protein